jgi:hypothetical protein
MTENPNAKIIEEFRANGGPVFADFEEATTRQIPVVVLEPVG